jgi:hypothetical protein
MLEEWFGALSDEWSKRSVRSLDGGRGKEHESETELEIWAAQKKQSTLWQSIDHDHVHPISSSGFVGYHFPDWRSKRGAIDSADERDAASGSVNADEQWRDSKAAKMRAILTSMIWFKCGWWLGIVLYSKMFMKSMEVWRKVC